MEQRRNRLWSRTKLGGMPHLPPLTATAASYDTSSWEEQAFAEDSAGHLGGCVWPPRSYSCNFCGREFRSAQALGGHMNVHRQDRARLRQSPTNHIEKDHRLHHQRLHHPQNPCSPLAAQYPLVYSNSPNPNTNPGAAASPRSPSRVSVASTHENCSENAFVSPSYLSPLVKEGHKRPIWSITRPHTDLFSLRILTVPELRLGTEGLKRKEMDCGNKSDGGFEEEEEEEEDIISTKRRIDVTIPFIAGSPPGEGSPLQSEVTGVCPTNIEELDLELRLGGCRR